MHYLELGSHPELSKAELLAVYGSQIQVIHDLGDILLLKSANGQLNPSIMQERLAGIVKIGEIIAQTGMSESNLIEELAGVMFEELQTSGSGGKIRYGISVYGKQSSKIAKNRHKIGLTIKKMMKEMGFSARFVDAKEPVLSSVIIKTNKLIESGAEFVLTVVDNNILIGRTMAVQDFKAWSHRDFGRPARDAKSGMLPPKLARLMINLSGVEPKGASLLDPFCGSGTILMEAGLLGFEKVMGSDESEKAIADSRTNLEWMGIKTQLVQVKAENLKFNTVDAIVTETYLGKPMKGNETRAQIEEQTKTLMAMYEKSFRNLFGLLKSNGKMAAAFPTYRVGEKLIRLPVQAMLEKIGFKMSGKSLMYEREGQKVAREIFVLEK